MSHTRMSVHPFLVSGQCHFDYCKNNTVRTITQLPLYISSRNYIGICIRPRQSVGYNYGCFSIFVESYDPLIVFLLLMLCYFHSCTPNNLVTLWDIFIKFHSNVF